MDQKSLSSKRHYIFGCIFVALLVCFWIGLGVVSKTILNKSDIGAFFLVYVMKGSYITSGIVWFLKVKYHIHKKNQSQKDRNEITKGLTDVQSVTELLHTPPYRRLIRLSVPLMVWSVACAYLYTLSLELTTIGINSTLYQSFVVFVYFLSALFLKETVTVIKVFSVFCCMAGVIMVSYAAENSDKNDDDDDDCQTKNTFFGVVLVLVSSFLYSGFQVLYAKFITEEERRLQESEPGHISDPFSLDAPLFSDFTKTLFLVGSFGFLCLISCWLLLLLLQILGWEHTSFPSDPEPWILLVVNICLTNSFENILWMALTFVSPLFVSVGSILTIPLSIVVDYLFYDLEISLLVIFGSLLIALGFIILNLAMKDQEDKERINSLTIPPETDSDTEIVGPLMEPLVEPIAPSEEESEVPISYVHQWLFYGSSILIYIAMFISPWLTELQKPDGC